MMPIPIDEVCYFDVITSTPSTSAAVDADSAPTFDVFEEDTDTAILAAQTMTKRTSKTGNYRGTFTASAANGFEAGKWYSVIASGVVGGVTGKCRAMHFRVAPAESQAGVPKSDAAYFGGTALTQSGGRPEVNATHWGGTAVASAVILAAANIASDAITAAKIAADAITSSKIADGALTAAKFASGAFDAVWSVATRILTAGTNIVLAKGTGITGFTDLDASGIRSAVGLGSANLDTQLSALSSSLSTIAGYIDTEVAAIKAKTDNLPSDPADASDIAASFSSLASTLSTIAGYIDTEVAAIKAKTDNLPAAPAATGDIPTTAQIADKVLGRNQAGGSDGGRTVTSALRALRNKVVIDGSTITVYEEDDVTVAWSGTVTRADLDALQTVDPS